MNGASGAAWDIALDAPRRRADGRPAAFGARRIRWRNEGEGAVFDLDRATGVLTVTRASSTGGYVAVSACTA